MILVYINESEDQVLEEELKPEIKKEEKDDEKVDPKNQGEDGKAKSEPEAKGLPAGKGEMESKKKQKKVNQEERSVHVKVGPGQMMIVKVNTIDDDWGFVTSLFYKEEVAN